MTDKEILLSRVLDKRSESDKNTMITHTPFLSPDEISEVYTHCKSSRGGVKLFYYGGFSQAERQAVFFVPECYGIDDIYEYFIISSEDNPIAAIKVQKDRFSSLTHRDYLGAVMGLGIKREMIGDIIICDDEAYIICFKSVADFICENLTRSGRATLSCSVSDVADVKFPLEKTELRFHSVASLRLDNILCAGFSVQRSSCNEYISKGLVFVNSSKATKCDATVKVNDKIVLRGKGKIVLADIVGESKKGRIHITVKHYL